MPDDWVGHPQRKDYPLGGAGRVPRRADPTAGPAEVPQLMTQDPLITLGGQDWDEIVSLASEAAQASG